jgi:hypothetical protein
MRLLTSWQEGVPVSVYMTWTSLRQGTERKRAPWILAVHSRIKTRKEPSVKSRPTVDFLTLNRIQARQVTGLLRGHCDSNGRLFRLGTTNDPTCGRCYNEIEAASHGLCVCEAVAKLRFCWFGKHFMKPGDYDEIPLCKILCFVWGTGLLAYWKWEGVKTRTFLQCTGRFMHPLHL